MYEHDATELAWKNGAEYMREEILIKLYDDKGKALGAERRILDTIIERIKKMEVRV